MMFVFTLFIYLFIVFLLFVVNKDFQNAA